MFTKSVSGGIPNPEGLRVQTSRILAGLLSVTLLNAPPLSSVENLHKFVSGKKNQNNFLEPT